MSIEWLKVEFARKKKGPGKQGDRVISRKEFDETAEEAAECERIENLTEEEAHAEYKKLTGMTDEEIEAEQLELRRRITEAFKKVDKGHGNA